MSLADDVKYLALEVGNLEVELDRRLQENVALRAPWRAVDAMDWEYIMSALGDGGRDRFWKAVLAEMRAALPSA